MSLSSDLKKRTRTLHEKVEDRMMSRQMLQAGFTMQQYLDILRIQLYFYARHEELVFKAASSILPSEVLDDRMKFNKLVMDAADLELELPAMTTGIDKKPGESLGWLYVMEGSMLGGQVIVRSLMKNNEIRKSGAVRFYRGYGEQTGTKWLEFKNAIDELEVDPAERSEVLEGAIDAFQEYLLLSSLVENNS